MKCLCGSKKLKAYNFDDLNYIYYQIDNYWVLENPLLTYFYSTQNYFTIKCLNCQKIWNENKISPKKSKKIDHKEIVLDLDHTLFYVDSFEIKDFDFSFKDPKHNITYYAKKRPYLDKSIRSLESRFEKINFFTSAMDWYADILISSLKINPLKIGFIKTRKDTYEARPLSFDRELMKPLNDSLIIEDKPLIIDGYNNTIFKVSPYYGGKDKELLTIIKNLSKEESEIIEPKYISGEIYFHIRKIKIKFSKLPIWFIKKILSLPNSSQKELDKFNVIMPIFKPYIKITENFSEIFFLDLSYNNYKKLMGYLKIYSKSKLLTKSSYNKNQYKKINDNF